MLQIIQKVYAAGNVATKPILKEIDGFTTLADVLGLVLNIVVGIGVALVVIFLVLGGIQYVMSKGDVKAADAARQSLTNAIIGFIVIIGAFTIRVIVQNVIGVEDSGVKNVTPF